MKSLSLTDKIKTKAYRFLEAFPSGRGFSPSKKPPLQVVLMGGHLHGISSEPALESHVGLGIAIPRSDRSPIWKSTPELIIQAGREAEP